MSALEQALGGPVIEVVAKATRRRFTVEYKRKVVREADACRTPGAVGALLRRGGGGGGLGGRAEEPRARAASHRSARQEVGRAGAGDQPVASAPSGRRR